MKPGPENTKLFMLKLKFYMMICEQNIELSMESYSEMFYNLGA